MAEEGGCPGSVGNAGANAEPSSWHRRAKPLPSNTPRLRRGLAPYRGHGLNSDSVNPGWDLHLGSQVWMRPNRDVTALCDLEKFLLCAVQGSQGHFQWRNGCP